MKLFFALLAAAVLAGCSSSGTMTGKADAEKPRSVFIEPFGGDMADYSAELTEYAGLALARRGYDAIREPQAASYRLRSSLFWTLSRVDLAVRLVDTGSGQVVYFGECKNGFIGAFLASSKAMSDCFQDALAALQ